MAWDRTIQAVGTKKEVLEGAGVPVGRVLPQPRLGLEALDPFLLLDHFRVKPGGPGFPEHPHRGFEILTYLRQGSGSHKDNFGNEATVHAGGLMHLNAGKGMWHGEGGGDDGGIMEGLQFWVNLKKSQKKLPPSFQAAEDKDLPRLTQDEGRCSVKVLVGPGSPITMLTPMVYLEATVKPKGRFEWGLPAGHQGFVYVMDGAAGFPADGAMAAAGQVAVLGGGSGLRVVNEGPTDLNFLLAAGEPHREPVIWNGPFVD